MRYLNSSRRGAPLVSLFGMCLSGALSDGAIKVIEKLAMINYPLPTYVIASILISQVYAFIEIIFTAKDLIATSTHTD